MKTQWLVLFMLVAFNTSIKGERYNGCVGGVQGLTFKPAEINFGDSVEGVKETIYSIHGYDVGRRLIENTDIVGCFLEKACPLHMYPMAIAHCYSQLLNKESKDNTIDAYRDKENELFWHYVVGSIRVIDTVEDQENDYAEVNQILTVESAKQLQVGFSSNRAQVEQKICFMYGYEVGRLLIENTDIIDRFLGKEYSLVEYPRMFAQLFNELIEKDNMRTAAMNADADSDNERQVQEDNDEKIAGYCWRYLRGMNRFFEIVISAQ